MACGPTCTAGAGTSAGPHRVQALRSSSAASARLIPTARTRSRAAWSASSVGSPPPAATAVTRNRSGGAVDDVDRLGADRPGRAEQDDVARGSCRRFSQGARRSASTTSSGQSAWSAVSSRSARPSGPPPCVDATQASRASETAVATIAATGARGPGAHGRRVSGGGRPQGEHDEGDGRGRDVRGRGAVCGLRERGDHEGGQAAGGQYGPRARAQAAQAERGDDVRQARAPARPSVMIQRSCGAVPRPAR